MRENFQARSWHHGVVGWALVLVLGALRGVAGAPSAPNLVSARSQSGQFVVYGGGSIGSRPLILEWTKNPSFVELEPALTAVSCERIKQLLLRELGASRPWQGTVYPVLYPAKSASDAITITSERFKGGWQYRVDIPDVVERERYVGAIVQVLLVELANRTAQARAAEVPRWLSEGLSQLLLAANEEEIILPPPRGDGKGLNYSATVVKGRKATLLEQAQKKLRRRSPLTFENLSWPTEEQLSGEAGELYSGCAQLFVGELLRLSNGRACLLAMLAQLPQYHNWQFAFLSAFRAHFQRLLDVEKWWALVLVQVEGRNRAQTWPLEESWRKLDQAVHAPVQVRTSANELPMHAEVPLQTIIREWDPVRQSQALNRTFRELELVHLRISEELLALVQDYHQTIQTYLQQRDRSRSVLPLVRSAARRRAAAAALQQLDALDARRQALRPAPKPPGAAQPSAAPAALP